MFDSGVVLALGCGCVWGAGRGTVWNLEGGEKKFFRCWCYFLCLLLLFVCLIFGLVFPVGVGVTEHLEGCLRPQPSVPLKHWHWSLHSVVLHNYHLVACFRPQPSDRVKHLHWSLHSAVYVTDHLALWFNQISLYLCVLRIINSWSLTLTTHIVCVYYRLVRVVP